MSVPKIFYGSRDTTIANKKAAKKRESKKGPEDHYRASQSSWLRSECRRLDGAGLLFDEVCTHEPARVCMAADYTRGLSGGSGGVAVRRDVVYNRLTHLASLSGNHVVGGRLLYLHTDGSVSLAVGGEQACSCGYVHQ